MSKCKTCAHSRVCKHVAEFTELEGKLPKTAPPFTSEIKCDSYTAQQPTVRDYVLAQTSQQWPPQQVYRKGD